MRMLHSLATLWRFRIRVHLGWLLLLSLTASPAWAQLSFLASTQSGFTTQTFTSPDLKTIDFNTTTLANASGVTSATTLGSSGGAFTATASTSLPTGFAGNYAKITSGTGSSTGSKLKLTFAGGTTYVSFLWNLATGSSDNTVKFNLSNGTSVSVSNCSSNTSGCVGGYNASGFFDSLWDFLFLGGGTTSTQSARLIYQPPSGVTVSSVELTALRYRDCALFIFCTNVSRDFKLDAFSYVDNSANVPAGLHHLEILSDDATGLTCRASVFRVRACANASCSSLYTSGVTGNLAFSGSGITYPSGASFSIPAGSSTSSDESVAFSSTGTMTAAASSVSPAPTATGYCGLGAPGSNASGACSFVVGSSGLDVSLPHHRAGTSQAITVSLVKKATFGSSCVAIGTSGTLSTSITAVYSGAVAPTLNGVSLTNGVAKTVSLVLNASGQLSTPFQYANSGTVQIKAELLSVVSGLLSGVVGLKGGTVATVAPNAFKIEPVVGGVVGSTTPVGAGNTFQIKISALNALPTPTVTTNFGSETGLDAITIGKSLLKPATRQAGAANNPALTIDDIVFVNGVATVDLSWPEVGTLDLSATLGNYLASGMSVTGALTGTLASGLRLVPDSFEIVASPASGTFTYAGQPFSVAVKAINATGATTLNYDGSQALAADRIAKAVSLTAVSGATGGSFGVGGTLAATAFANGAASGNLTYTMTNKLTAPNSVAFKATDADVTDSTLASMVFRSGRIKLSNAFGSETAPLQIPIQVQYWSGKSWVPASDDTYTIASLLPLSAVTRSNYKAHQGSALSSWTTAPTSLSLTAGSGVITLAAPGTKKTGSVDIALDLGATGANLPWLRSLDNACGANTVCDPKARASFGVYAPETQKTVTIQDAF